MPLDIIINANKNVVPLNHVSIPDQGNFYHHLLTCFGYPEDTPPVADLLRQYHGLKGRWLVASPIHWQATHNDAMIIASTHELQLSDEASRHLFAVFMDSVSHENMQAHYHDAHTWLLQCDDKPPLISKPVHALLHQSMMPKLRQLDSTGFWQRFLTENQMLFSAHSFNQDSHFAYPVNGIWLWGVGTLNARVDKKIVCNEVGLHRLADLLSTQVSGSLSSLPADSVLLFNDLDDEASAALQDKLKKNKPHWYWNNRAYKAFKLKNRCLRWLERLL